MSTFSVPVTIGVDEDKIAREIESEVKEKVIRIIGDKVEKIIYKEYDDYSYSRGMRYVEKVKSNEPLRRMVERKVDDILEKERDAIVILAAEKLADKLSRQKKVREMAADVAKDVMEV